MEEESVSLLSGAGNKYVNASAEVSKKGKRGSYPPPFAPSTGAYYCTVSDDRVPQLVKRPFKLN